MATKSTFAAEICKNLYYSIRNNNFVYLNIVNSKEKKALESFKFDINEKQRQVLKDLNLTGISRIKFTDLFNESVLNTMLDW